MDLLRAAILGIVQGLTEFLPVSSSGHLILVPALFKWPDQGQAFDVGLHVGTLLALLAYFWRDWRQMVTIGLQDLAGHRLRFAEHRFESRLIWMIAAGSIPAAITGLLLNSWIEDNLRQPWLIAILLALIGTLMLAAERLGKQERVLGDVRLVDAVLLGIGQAFALMPGVSRSGVTMSVGMFAGLTRDAATRFAFLLGTPAFIGAAILKAPDLAGSSGREWAELGIGFGFSAIVGLAAIHYLLVFVRTHTLVPFVVYRYGVAALTLIIGAIRIA